MRALEPWVEEITLQRSDTSMIVLPPDPATTVVWRINAAGESDVLIAGPRTKASYHSDKELPVCLRLRIRPGQAMPLLGIAADELVDRIVPLSDLWTTAAGLAERLDRDHPEQAVAVIGTQLLERLPRRLPERFEVVGAAVEELSSRRSVGETATRLGVSDRYLRRIFRQAVGLSPKHFARIARVRGLISEDRRSWSTAAARAGYADQSHLIADFRALMRVTPAAFATGRVPVTNC